MSAIDELGLSHQLVHSQSSKSSLAEVHMLPEDTASQYL